MGFFAEAGPLQIFVSNHLVPEDYEFDSAHEPAYASAAGDKIVAGCEVRVRIVGTRVDANEIVS
jgi:DNA-directed RNA polymerase II subunit RPB7